MFYDSVDLAGLERFAQSEPAPICPFSRVGQARPSPHTGKAVVHLGCSGGTEGYCSPTTTTRGFRTPTSVSPSRDCVLLHLHSAMVVQGPRWGVLDMVKTYRDQRIPVYLTIHDHQ